MVQSWFRGKIKLFLLILLVVLKTLTLPCCERVISVLRIPKAMQINMQSKDVINEVRRDLQLPQIKNLLLCIRAQFLNLIAPDIIFNRLQ